MFGEISLLAWMGSAIVFAIGGGAGFFIARQIKDKRTLELEEKLQATQNKLTDYQGEVNRHFLKSSLLFNKLTDNYREVYEHLATGAQKLCNEKPLTTALDLPDAKILSAAISASSGTESLDAIKTEAASVELPKTEPRVNEESAEHVSEETEHLGAESIVDHQTIFENNTEAQTTDNVATDDATNIAANIDAKSSETTLATTEQTTATETSALTEASVDAQPEAPSKEKPATTETDSPTPTEAELKTLEANEKTQEEEDVHLGAESTPGVELDHHKTHPAIH